MSGDHLSGASGHRWLLGWFSAVKLLEDAGCRVEVRPIGVLLMRDEKGLDEKILAAVRRYAAARDSSSSKPPARAGGRAGAT